MLDAATVETRHDGASDRRREWGGLLVAASKLVTTFAEQTQLFRRILDLNYSDAGGI